MDLPTVTIPKIDHDNLVSLSDYCYDEALNDHSPSFIWLKNIVRTLLSSCQTSLPYKSGML